jgi:hypothetical protein
LEKEKRTQKTKTQNYTESRKTVSIWNSIKEGIIHEGWQDTVLLMPGMKIRLIMDFNDFKGLLYIIAIIWNMRIWE